MDDHKDEKYNFHAEKDEAGLWWVYNHDKLLIGLGSFPTEEWANKAIAVFNAAD